MSWVFLILSIMVLLIYAFYSPAKNPEVFMVYIYFLLMSTLADIQKKLR